MIEIQIKKGHSPVILSAALEIREAVFREEQAIPKEIDLDGKDEHAFHIVGYHEGRPFGCCRLRRIDSKIKFERLAVIKEYRRRGIARVIVEAAIDYAKQQQCSELYLHARSELEEFYERFGFSVRGDIFYEADLPHLLMYLSFG